MADITASKGNFDAFLLLWISFSSYVGCEEHCISEVFEAKCPVNEVVVMESALYGRMELGRCVDTSHDLGCRNDALSELDAHCSGHKSCRLVISNTLWKDGTDSCGKHLVGYADLAFLCKEVLPIETKHCHGAELTVSSKTTALSSKTIDDVCGHNVQLSVGAEAGQTLNVSLFNFNLQSASIGTIRDTAAHNSAEISSGVRVQHLLNTIGSRIEINLFGFSDSDVSYILEFQVSGCGDMSPPDGAWMTRDGDVMEMGCHAGSKTWSLQCKNNQWVGVLGYCGSEEGAREEKEEAEERTSVWSVSPNVLVFGASSLIILLSASVFLAGVIILKRKLTPSTDKDLAQHTLPLISQPALTREWNTRSNPPVTGYNGVPGYKSLSQVNTNSNGHAGDSEKTKCGNIMQDNSTQSERSGDSVKYYVLEDAIHEPALA